MPHTQFNAMDAITVDAGLVVNSNSSNILPHTPANDAASREDTIYATDPYSYNLFAAQHDNYTNWSWDQNWRDPTDDIVFVANELMFRAGLMSLRLRTWEQLRSLVDPGVQIEQTVLAQQEITQNVYKSDLRWYAGAAVVQIATALLTLPMFWGWWRLGCNVTLSPFSIALAFDSPVLSDVNSAAGPKGVVDKLGGMRLKYGAVGSFEREEGKGSGFQGRLGVAESSAVLRPETGMTFRR